MTTTWKEFKERVEGELEAQGLSNDIKILYIDINGSDDFSVSVQKDTNVLAID